MSYTHHSKKQMILAKETSKRLINGRIIVPQELMKFSPVAIPEHGPEQAAVLLRTLWQPGDLIALHAGRRSTKSERYGPSSWSHVYERDEFASRMHDPEEWDSIAGDNTGAFYRINPVRTKKGTGHNGSFTDADVARFLYLLIEHDDLELNEQLSLQCSLRLPLAALVLTGGKSVHGLVHVAARDADEFDLVAKKIYKRLNGLGFDNSNKNPSRLSRLPGVLRKANPSDDKPASQELLYLNPNPLVGKSIFDQMNIN